MIIKGIGATTHEDSHKCRLTKKALENAVDQINNGKYAPAIGIEHDSTIMPIGKTIKAEMVQLKDGEFAVVVYQETFENINTTSISNFGTVYIASSVLDNRPFADTEPSNYERTTIELDPVNFDFNEFQNMCEELNQEYDINCKTIMRKSLIPDPEIVINFIKDTFLILCGAKVLEKTVESFSEDAASIIDRLKRIVLSIIKNILPKNRPITYVLKENRGYILELIIRTNNVNTLFHALSSEVLSHIIDDVDKFRSIIDEPTYKIQFIYNELNSKWEFNYLSTSTGKVIGSEKCYKRTTELSKHYLEKMRNNNE